MDPEEKNIEENNVAPEIKSAVSNELSSFMNPYSESKISSPVQNPTPSQEVPIVPQPPMQTTETMPVQEEIHRPIVRTFKSDVEETIQSQHLSSINIALAENKKMMDRIQSAELEQKTIKKNYTMLIVSSLLILGGILAFAIPYYLVNKEYTETVPAENTSSGAIITADIEEKLNIDGLNLDRLAISLSERVDQSSIRLGNIKSIYLTEGQGVNEKAIDSTKFLYLIKTNVPGEISRTLKPAYMFGMHNFNGNQRFLVLKVGSYENAYAGMLAWEVDLWSDFKNLFGLSDTSASGQSSTGRANGIDIKKFQDAVYSNKDSRVVKDSSGKILFLYSIVDKNTIVITTNPNTLKEIITRNNKAQTVAQ